MNDHNIDRIRFTILGAAFLVNAAIHSTAGNSIMSIAFGAGAFLMMFATRK